MQACKLAKCPARLLPGNYFPGMDFWYYVASTIFLAGTSGGKILAIFTFHRSLSTKNHNLCRVAELWSCKVMELQSCGIAELHSCGLQSCGVAKFMNVCRKHRLSLSAPHRCHNGDVKRQYGDVGLLDRLY